MPGSQFGAYKQRRLLRKTLPASLDDRLDMLRPIVQHTRIDVCSVWPDKRTLFFIDFGLPEQVKITHSRVAITFPIRCALVCSGIVRCGLRSGR